MKEIFLYPKAKGQNCCQQNLFTLSNLLYLTHVLEALALSWIYVKSWGVKAKHLEVLWQLWKFDFQTIRQALTSIYTPDPDESNQHIVELTKLIRQRFDTQTELFSWSQALYQEVYFDCPTPITCNFNFRCTIRIINGINGMNRLINM